ncbi:unnamed protein product [Amoebophrya sp. A120]|nr:unnamed protein product [Amoebophrya sp. A120]|eukprot:GSA120T00012165001.1
MKKKPQLRGHSSDDFLRFVELEVPAEVLLRDSEDSCEQHSSFNVSEQEATDSHSSTAVPRAPPSSCTCCAPSLPDASCMEMRNTSSDKIKRQHHKKSCRLLLPWASTAHDYDFDVDREPHEERGADFTESARSGVYARRGSTTTDGHHGTNTADEQPRGGDRDRKEEEECFLAHFMIPDYEDSGSGSDVDEDDSSTEKIINSCHRGRDEKRALVLEERGCRNRIDEPTANNPLENAGCATARRTGQEVKKYLLTGIATSAGRSTPRLMRSGSSSRSPGKNENTNRSSASGSGNKEVVKKAGLQKCKLCREIGECRAWHGTKFSSARDIWSEGFNTSHSGRNRGNLFGDGVYQSPHVCKAMQYAKENIAGERYVICSRCLIGNNVLVTAQRFDDKQRQELFSGREKNHAGPGPSTAGSGGSSSCQLYSDLDSVLAVPASEVPEDILRKERYQEERRFGFWGRVLGCESASSCAASSGGAPSGFSPPAELLERYHVCEEDFQEYIFSLKSPQGSSQSVVRLAPQDDSIINVVDHSLGVVHQNESHPFINTSVQAINRLPYGLDAHSDFSTDFITRYSRTDVERLENAGAVKTPLFARTQKFVRPPARRGSGAEETDFRSVNHEEHRCTSAHQMLPEYLLQLTRVYEYE